MSAYLDAKETVPDKPPVMQRLEYTDKQAENHRRHLERLSTRVRALERILGTDGPEVDEEIL
jgi:hypothetical protein